MKFPKFLAFLEKDSNVWLTSAGTGLLAGGAVAAGLYLTSTVVLPTIATSAVTIAALIVTATGFGAIALVVVGLLAAAALFAFRRRGGDAFSSPATLPAVNSDLEQMQPYASAPAPAPAPDPDPASAPDPDPAPAPALDPSTGPSLFDQAKEVPHPYASDANATAIENPITDAEIEAIIRKLSSNDLSDGSSFDRFGALRGKTGQGWSYSASKEDNESLLIQFFPIAGEFKAPDMIRRDNAFPASSEHFNI